MHQNEWGKFEDGEDLKKTSKQSKLKHGHEHKKKHCRKKWYFLLLFFVFLLRFQRNKKLKLIAIKCWAVRITLLLCSNTAACKMFNKLKKQKKMYFLLKRQQIKNHAACVWIGRQRYHILTIKGIILLKLINIFNIRRLKAAY